MSATRQTVEQLLQALYDGEEVLSEVIADAIEESGLMPKKWCFYGGEEARWLEDEPGIQTDICGSVANILNENGSILKWIVQIRKAIARWPTVPSLFSFTCRSTKRSRGSLVEPSSSRW